MRNGKSRKEIWFSQAEVQQIKQLASEFHLDETSVIRMLLHLGTRALAIPTGPFLISHNVKKV